MSTPPNFYEQALELFEYTRGLRRDFHTHPELGFREVRTAGIVARELQGLGLEVTAGVAKTGVVAMIDGAQPGPVLLLRFDMDALPIQEETGAAYASQTEGVMHACGHDGHTSIGLTVARMLNACREDLKGSVKLVFQPAEEGLGGAEGMIDEGVMHAPEVDKAMALHVWNEKPVGWVGVVPGPFMAGGEIFKIKIKGKGGHGAMPETTADPVLAAAQLVTALQSIVSRNVPPMSTAVVSVTQLNTGTAFNVIPGTAELAGTIRTFEPQVREKVLARFEQISQAVVSGMGCEAEVDVQRLTPPVINDPQTTELVQRVVRESFADLDLETEYQVMGSEDMAYMLEQVPGCFFMVGSANAEKGLNFGHHHPRFDFDERVLPRAAAIMAASAYKFLQGS
jgi:amidohydrolase